MRISQVLGVLLVVLEAVSIGLFLLCGQTIFSIMNTVSPSGGGQIPVKVDEVTQMATLTYTSTPRNSGFLTVELGIGFGITLSDGSYSVKNITRVYLLPGRQSDVNITIKVPVVRLQKYADGEGTLDVYTAFSTLNDFVRLEYNTRVVGGA